MLTPLYKTLTPLGRSFGAAGQAVLFYDTFTGANGTLITSRPPDIGTSWTSLQQTWTIDSNRARADAAGASPFGRIVANDTAADCVIDVDYVALTDINHEGGPIFRRSAGNVFWYVDMTPSIVRLYEYTGSFVLRASEAVTVNTGTWPVKVTLLGNSITVNAAGKTITYTSSTNATEKQHGMLIIGAPVTRLDNFKVTA